MSKDYTIICSTPSIRALVHKQQETSNLEFIENFYLFVDCLNLLQHTQLAACVELYRQTIEKIHLTTHIQAYQGLLEIFYFYHLVQKSPSKASGESHPSQTIIIE